LSLFPSESDGSARAGKRRRLTSEQQLELSQLYKDPTISAATIRQRFGISDSSLYRILERHGVALRGRRSPSAERAATNASAPAPAPVQKRRGRPPGASYKTLVRAANDDRETPATTVRQFRVAFRATRILSASTLLEAVRQAESLGATEVLAVSREP
jgi:transposase-like protein